MSTKILLKTMLLLFLGASVSFAADQKESGSLQLKVSSTTQILSDGLKVEPEDPVLIDDEARIFISLDDASRIFGKPVKYQSGKIYVGALPVKTEYLTEFEYLSYKGNQQPMIDPPAADLSIGREKYSHGIRLTGWIYGPQPVEVEIDYNLRQNFRSLSVDVGIDDSFLRERDHDAATATFFVITDGTIVKRVEGVKVGDFPRRLNVDVTNAIRLTLKARIVLSKPLYREIGIDFGNPVVSSEPISSAEEDGEETQSQTQQSPTVLPGSTRNEDQGTGRSFFVAHDHGGMFTRHCAGTLYVFPEGVQYVVERSTDGRADDFTVEYAEIAEAEKNKWPLSKYSAFHLKLVTSANFNFAHVNSSGAALDPNPILSEIALWQARSAKLK